jgi:hypothetical protein
MEEQERLPVQLGLDVDVPVAIRLPRGLGIASQLVLARDDDDQGEKVEPSWQ